MSSSVAGSPQSPVCTADGWMIVLDGATSQWKRAVVSSAAIGPASGSPCGDSLDRLEVRSHGLGIDVGPQRGEPLLVERRARTEVVERSREHDDAHVDPLAALDARDDAVHGVGERSYRRSRALSASSTNVRGESSRPRRYAT